MERKFTQKAVTEFIKNNYLEAMKYYALALDYKEFQGKIEESKILFNIGVCCIKTKAFQDAINYFNRYMEKHRNYGALFNKGCVYLMLNNYKKSLVTFYEASTIDDSDNDLNKIIKELEKDLLRER